MPPSPGQERESENVDDEESCLFDAAAPGPPAVAAAVEVVAVAVAAPSCAREFSNIVRYTSREWVYGHLSASV